MKQYDADSILKEYVRRFGDTSSLEDTRELGHRTFKWRNDLFDYQLGFIDDESQIKTALCSRRSGKTYASCYYLLEEASRYPDIICAYIALTRRSAKRLMWTELKRADRKYMLNIKFNNAELVAELKNGSQIILAGADDEAEVDKLRGSAYRLVIIDEAASFGPHLSVLIEEVLEPALVDHNGTLAMIGTPAAHCSGIFYEATTGIRPEYSKHSWTIMENPHIPHAEEWLDRRRKQKRWTDDNPIYQREWQGLTLVTRMPRHWLWGRSAGTCQTSMWWNRLRRVTCCRWILRRRYARWTRPTISQPWLLIPGGWANRLLRSFGSVTRCP